MKKLLMVVAMVIMMCAGVGCGSEAESADVEVTSSVATNVVVEEKEEDHYDDLYWSYDLYEKIQSNVSHYATDEEQCKVALNALSAFYNEDCERYNEGCEEGRVEYWGNVYLTIDMALNEAGLEDIYNYQHLSSNDISWILSENQYEILDVRNGHQEWYTSR